MDQKKFKFSHKLLDKYFKQKVNEQKIPFLSTPQISDGLKKTIGIHGVIPGVKAVNHHKIFGQVVTAYTKADDWGTSVQVIDSALPGEIIFIYAEGDNHAVWGELTSTAAKKKGIAGTIIFGACRDLDAIKIMDYPVFSKKVIPNAGWPRGDGDININLDCEGTLVKPGDFVVGDDCGVVVIPQSILKEVMQAAKDIKNLEKKITKQLANGKTLSEILKL